ncbi:hypothetical protein ACIBF5_15845 [Micromonospora sp. NPDC050417]|uniref:hypothetical protein n=1 Tax=Micromonospora sp. NPDC050417 TaxID=3364280 RepID=UPI0037888ED8
MSEGARPALTKRTYNHTAPVDATLTWLVARWGVPRTDAVGRAVLIAAVIDRIAPDGHLMIQRSDGTTTEVFLV